MRGIERETEMDRVAEVNKNSNLFVWLMSRCVLWSGFTNEEGNYRIYRSWEICPDQLINRCLEMLAWHVWKSLFLISDLPFFKGI